MPGKIDESKWSRAKEIVALEKSDDKGVRAMPKPNLPKSEYWAGLNKTMKEWAPIKGVHKPTDKKGVSETGEKVREAHSAHQQGDKLHAQHAEQKARIRHDDVIAEQRRMPKPGATDYATQAEPKVNEIKSKWGKVKEQIERN